MRWRWWGEARLATEILTCGQHDDLLKANAKILRWAQNDKRKRKRIPFGNDKQRRQSITRGSPGLFGFLAEVDDLGVEEFGGEGAGERVDGGLLGWRERRGVCG